MFNQNRLIDRIWKEWPGLIGNIPVFIADEVRQIVVQEILSMSDDEQMEFPTGEEFGCVAPPFDEFWIEAREKNCLVDGKLYKAVYRGAHFVSVLFDDYAKRYKSNKDIDWLFDAKWVYSIVPYWCFIGRKEQTTGIVGPKRSEIVLSLDKDGYILQGFDKVPLILGDDRDEIILKQGMAVLATALKTINMIHNKVYIERHERPQYIPPKKKEQKPTDAEREPNVYYVLNLTGKVYGSGNPTGPNDKSGKGYRAHLVRGSFATYHSDAPLFGKYTGTFWRPGHEKPGTSGRVIKRYNVTRGQGES